LHSVCSKYPKWRWGRGRRWLCGLVYEHSSCFATKAQ
jgi:hypothetical protein